MRLINLVGMCFGRLTVKSRAPNSMAEQPRWNCLCICGVEKVVHGTALRSGNTKSCGCLNSEMTAKRNLTHGDSYRHQHTPEYRSWAHMKERCYNPSIWNYHNYGGRGIAVCDEWLSSFKTFLTDMGRKPSKLHSLDRFPDNNAGYSKANCRWATKSEQVLNQRPRRTRTR